MRNVSRRPFTVEVKSTGRRAPSIIPTRIAAALAQPARPQLLSAALPSAPAAEKRRILPNLIVPEVPQAEPEPMPLAEEQVPKRPRGRPRKVRPAPIEPLAAPVEKAAPAPVSQVQETLAETLPQAARSLRKRQGAPALDLPRGERWKRRLGRWSR